jgi:dipeptidyl aminopeptidase/acylaminoacyl peptidase
MPKDGALLLKEEIKIDKKLLAFWKSKNIPTESLAQWQETAKRIRISKIVYQSNGHRVFGFLCEPVRSKGKLPCIIWNRGGSGEFGAIKLGTAFGSLAAIADWGYVVIASQYSGNGGSEGSDDLGGAKTLNDVLNLKKVLEQVKRADLSRIGMYGASRGGMMTYLALAKVKWIKAAVTVAGLADLNLQVKTRRDMVEHYAHFGLKKKDYKVRSAVEWADKFCKKTPLLMMHGTGDWRVTVQESLKLSSKLYEAKVPYRLVVFEGADHSITEFRKERREMTREWFDRYLRNNASMPNLRPHGE